MERPLSIRPIEARPERLNMQPKIKERICPACNGTGVQPIAQAVQPGHRIYPVKCAACEGKGKIRDNAN